jgi:hypothetical protein
MRDACGMTTVLPPFSLVSVMLSAPPRRTANRGMAVQSQRSALPPGGVRVSGHASVRLGCRALHLLSLLLTSIYPLRRDEMHAAYARRTLLFGDRELVGGHRQPLIHL